MPFDEEEDDSLTEQPKNSRLKKVSSQKSIFDNVPKRPSYENFSKKVDAIQEKADSYKSQSAALALQFFHLINDKTLKRNKTIFSKEVEKELLTNLINISIEINNDPLEKEGMGSLALITILLKTVLMQKDKINELEFNLSELNKKYSNESLEELISKKIEALDLVKKSG